MIQEKLVHFKPLFPGLRACVFYICYVYICFFFLYITANEGWPVITDSTQVVFDVFSALIK